MPGKKVRKNTIDVIFFVKKPEKSAYQVSGISSSDNNESTEKSEENSGGHTPLLVFKRNRSKTYAVLDFEKFLELIKKA